MTSGKCKELVTDLSDGSRLSVRTSDPKLVSVLDVTFVLIESRLEVLNLVPVRKSGSSVLNAFEPTKLSTLSTPVRSVSDG